MEKNEKSGLKRDPIHSLPTDQNMLLSEHHFNSTIPIHLTEQLSQNSSVLYTRHRSVKILSNRKETTVSLTYIFLLRGTGSSAKMWWSLHGTHHNLSVWLTNPRGADLGIYSVLSSLCVLACIFKCVNYNCFHGPACRNI